MTKERGPSNRDLGFRNERNEEGGGSALRNKRSGEVRTVGSVWL